MPLFLPKNLASLAALAAKESTRFAMTAVRVLDLGGAYRCEVTDGRRLMVVRGPSEAQDYPALEDAPNGAAEVLVPAADWRGAFRLGGKSRPVGLAVGDGRFVLAVGDQAVTGSPPDKRFPDADGVLPRRAAVLAVALDPALLAGLLQVAAALEPEGGVKLLYYGPGKPVGLIAHNDQGQYLDALVMPLT